MVIDFSKVNCSEKPMLLLKNLDGTTIDIIGLAFNVQVDLSYNEISSVSFDVPAVVDNESVPYYDRITGMRIVELVGVGQFLLVDPSEENDGIRCVKSCKAYSLEYEFSKKNIYLEAGTYNFASGINASNEDTIVGRIKEKMPDWNFTVDASLIGKYRTFDDTDKKVYDFIKSDVQESFGCIFDFDTNSRSVSVIPASSIVETKPIYISGNSLLKSVQIDEDSDSIVTCLDVSGDENTNIRSVNPTGTNKIYNLDYFMKPDYLPQKMIDAWNSWKADYEDARSEYYDITMSYNMKLLNIAIKENELSDLNGALRSLENLQAVIISCISSGLKEQKDLDDINAKIALKKNEIADKSAEVVSLKESATETAAALKAINERLAFEKYFNENEIAILQRYFIEDAVQDSSFVPAASATYKNEDLNGDIKNDTISVSDASIEKAEKGNSTLFSIKGGIVSVDNFTANIVKGVVEHSNDGSFIFTAYLNSGSVSGASNSSFKSGNITVSGKIGDTGISVTGTQAMTIPVQSGRLYFTKNSTVYEEHQIEWDLYDYGESVLREHASPTYNFTVECSNFLTSDDYVSFRNQLALGKRVYLEINDEVLQPYVVSVHIEFEKPDGFSIEFSSSYNSFDKSFALTKLLEQSVSMGKTLSYKSGAYASFVNSGASNMVKEFMDASLDIAKKSVMSSGNQAITYSDTGMHVRKWKDDSKTSYEPEEIWIVDNMIAFTDDNWATSKMAIGKIFDQNFKTGYALTSDKQFVAGKTYYTKTNGIYSAATVTAGADVKADTYYEYTASANTVYGIAAPYLVGTMIAGENLFIESTKPDGEHMSFKVDGSGASLYNAKFIVKDKNREIILDPVLGFGIGSGSIVTVGDDGNETWDTDNARFWVDTGGNVHIKGKLEGCDGTFSGTLEASQVKINGDDILKTIDGKSKINSDYLDLGNIILDGKTGDITLGGNIELGGDINITGSIQWNSSNSPVTVQYSVDGSSWHDDLGSSDLYARYSYDGGISWTDAVQVRGVDGKNGANGRPGSDASVPKYIQGTYIDMNLAASKYIIGGKICATGLGYDDGAAFYIYDGGTGVDSSGEITDGVKVGYISYDKHGADTDDEAKYRVIFQTLDNTALKINAAGNMSLQANEFIYCASLFRAAGGIELSLNSGYGSSLPSSGTQGQLFFKTAS